MAPSKFCLQFAIYYTCLQIYAQTTPTTTPLAVTRPHPFLHPPLDVVNHVTSHVSSIPASDWSPELLPFVKLLQCYTDRLTDHTEAESLQALGLGKAFYESVLTTILLSRVSAHLRVNAHPPFFMVL